MNQKVLIVLSIFIISVFAESGRIAGGDVANLGDFKYHVKIEPSIGSFRRLCGGALIRYNWVITVAQCIYNARDIIVRLGVVDRLVGPEGAIFWIQNRDHIIVHQEFDGNSSTGNFTKDIGLIYLEDSTEEILDITFDNIRLINTIALPPSNDLNLETLPGVVTGFGFYEDGPDALQSMKLRSAEMNILPQEICRLYNPTIPDDNFCTDTSNGLSTCVGDEGGPFVTLIGDNPAVVGLAGTAFEECTVGNPAIFINLVSFYDWIIETIENPPFIPTVPPPTTTGPPNNNCICECHCHTCPKLETPTPTRNEAKTKYFWDHE